MSAIKKLIKAIVKQDIPNGLWYSSMKGMNLVVLDAPNNPKGKYKIEGTVMYIRKSHLDILGDVD